MRQQHGSAWPGRVIRIGVIVSVGLCLALSALSIGYWLWSRHQAVAPFQGSEEQMRTACGRCNAADLALLVREPGQRRGKILVVQAENGRADVETMDSLRTQFMDLYPAELGAARTLVCMGEVKATAWGRYQDGSSGLRRSRLLCLYDLSEQAAFFRHTIQGTEPPGAKTKNQSGAGSDPAGLMVAEYLAALPER